MINEASEKDDTVGNKSFFAAKNVICCVQSLSSFNFVLKFTKSLTQGLGRRCGIRHVAREADADSAALSHNRAPSSKLNRHISSFSSWLISTFSFRLINAKSVNPGKIYTLFHDDVPFPVLCDFAPNRRDLLINSDFTGSVPI